jgi:hypothetical protein
VYEALADSHPNSFVTGQLERAVTGTKLPDVDRAQRLHSQGNSLLSGESDGSTDALDQLWEEITAYGEGTVVVLDLEEYQ